MDWANIFGWGLAAVAFFGIPAAVILEHVFLDEKDREKPDSIARGGGYKPPQDDKRVQQEQAA